MTRNPRLRTRSLMFIAATCGYLSATAFAAPLRAQMLTPGDTLSIRMLDAVSSNVTSKGKRVRAMLIAPVLRDSATLVPMRSILEGTVIDAGKEKSGGERHIVQLQFTTLRLADSSSVPVNVRVLSVDNSRETVDADGRILGPAKASLVKSKEDWAAVALGSVTPIGAGILFAMTRGESDERNHRIDYSVGTDMFAHATTNASMPALASTTKPTSVGTPDELMQLVARIPLRASAAAGRIPGDFVNVVLVGDSASIQRAFINAGWDTPNKMGTKADFDTFIKTAEGQGYKHEPVSQQSMFGRTPDLIFQRVTDTFAKRHHVRLWRTDQRFNGQEVWVAPATHDIGVEISAAHRGFTHRTEANIDTERNKIANDLQALQQVDRVSFVQRAPAPDAAARGEVVSDWRVVIVHITN